MSPQLLKVGMIGGGGGAFIANPHQKAIHFDGTRRVHAVALHPDPQIAMNEANAWPYPVKGYESYDDMFADQAKLTEDERNDYRSEEHTSELQSRRNPVCRLLLEQKN